MDRTVYALKAKQEAAGVTTRDHLSPSVANGVAPWGQHLVLDLGDCDRAAITSAETISAFSKALVEEIEMVAFGEPTIVHFGHDNPATSGYSLVQLIETSNICAHFSDLTGDVYLDIFSCKRFDEAKAIGVCQKFLKPKVIQKHTMLRGIAWNATRGASAQAAE